MANTRPDTEISHGTMSTSTTAPNYWVLLVSFSLEFTTLYYIHNGKLTLDKDGRRLNVAKAGASSVSV